MVRHECTNAWICPPEFLLLVALQVILHLLVRLLAGARAVDNAGYDIVVEFVGVSEAHDPRVVTAELDLPLVWRSYPPPGAYFVADKKVGS